VFWKNKWEQWNQQSKWSLKHLKKVLLKWWRHQKQVHQKHLIKSRITRSWRSSGDERIKGCSKVLITPSIAKDQKSKATTNSNEFEGIGCLFFEERWQSTILRSLQPLSPLLSLCLCYRTRITATPATMFLPTWNGFDIDPS